MGLRTKKKDGVETHKHGGHTLCFFGLVFGLISFHIFIFCCFLFFVFFCKSEIVALPAKQIPEYRRVVSIDCIE